MSRPKFQQPETWPSIPPWWLVSSTEIAAILNVKPHTLIQWRVRGLGPPAQPPMYFKPTQGNPLWHQYGAFREWATGYSYEAQCLDFLKATYPHLTTIMDSVEGMTTLFDVALEEDRKRLLKGRLTTFLPADIIHDLDPWRARQPVRIKPSF